MLKRVQDPGRWARYGIGIVVACLLVTLGGCADEANNAPELLSIDDRVFTVNQSGSIDVVASDSDGDGLEFDFTIDPLPATQTAGGSAPQLIQISQQKAVFRWTPGIADAGGERFREYAVTFTVTDERGLEDVVRISLRVENPGVGGSSSLRFSEPPGEGMAVDLTLAACVKQVPVAVVADTVANADVSLVLGEPLKDGATLSPSGPGKSKLFNWCPTDADLEQSLSHTVVFRAEAPGLEPITKRFLIRFKRNAGAGCAGEAPVIAHSPRSEYNGPLNYEIEAEITDDVGFKSPPVLAFTADDSVASDASQWQLVEFSAGAGDAWVAAIPNLNLATGARQRVRYKIIATDNDDPNSTRCDHTTESPTYAFTAIGGGGGGQTYGLCAECVADAQCGGASDLCVDLRGKSFCGRACDNTGCGAGEQCLEVDSVDGVTGRQCFPEDLNCGQICFDDAYDGAQGNDTPDAAVPIEVGVHDALSICAQDQDYYLVRVEQGRSLTVRIRFENRAGDLDIAMRLPGAEAFDYQSLNADVDVEQLQERCLPTGGEVLIGVFPYEDAINQYTLEIEQGPGDCNRICANDRYDEAAPNDTLDDAVLFDDGELPVSEAGLRICRGDRDYYGFEAVAGQIIIAQIDFNHRDGDLDMRLVRLGGGEVGVSAGFRDTELIQALAPIDDIYILEVMGATPTVDNSYELNLNTVDVQRCAETPECPMGQYCANGACIEAVCNGAASCAGDHGCTPSRAGLDPASAGGVCLAYCDSDLSCRQDAGHTCKRFENFTSACGRAGAGPVGSGCGAYQDCAGDMVCFATPGGYCASGGCSPGECGEGTVCGDLNGFSACLKRCEGEGDCRIGEGHRCVDIGGGVSACVP